MHALEVLALSPENRSAIADNSDIPPNNSPPPWLRRHNSAQRLHRCSHSLTASHCGGAVDNGDDDDNYGDDGDDADDDDDGVVTMLTCPVH